MVRIGLVGAGPRVSRVYLPVIRALADQLELVGFTSRSPASRERLASETGLRPFDTARELCDAGAGLLIVAVNAAATGAVVRDLTPLPCHLLIETPIRDRDLLKVTRGRNGCVAIAEQTPFTPLEQFKEAVYRAGVMQRPYLVQNNGRAFDYHAIAQLRSWLGRAVRPTAVIAEALDQPMPAWRSRAGTASAAGTRDAWLIGTASFENGAVLQHQFSYACKSAPFRSVQQLVACSADGTLVSGRGPDAEPDRIIDMRFLDGVETRRADVREERDAAGCIVSLADSVSGVRWSNPFAAAGLDDEQVAVATLIVAAGAGAALYSMEDALVDTDIIAAMRRAARKRRRILLRGVRRRWAAWWPRARS
ncbi:MAG: Gfo/Idh/MocA family oxidoreductase [Planctomycetota bacterium]